MIASGGAEVNHKYPPEGSCNCLTFGQLEHKLTGSVQFISIVCRFETQIFLVLDLTGGNLADDRTW